MRRTVNKLIHPLNSIVKAPVNRYDRIANMIRGNDMTDVIHPDYRDWGIDPKSLPTVLTPVAFPAMPLGSVQEIWGFAGQYLAAKDLTGIPLEFIANITFDEFTIWPSS